jgi:hypothetical protein
MIDWLVFDANFSNISTISWHDKIVLLTYKTLRKKTYLSIKQTDYKKYVQLKRNIKKIKPYI